MYKHANLWWKIWEPSHFAALFTTASVGGGLKPKVCHPTIGSSRTKDIQSIFPLNKPLGGRLRLVWVRQVNREPDELARVLSHPLPFHPRNCTYCLFFTPCGEVHLGTDSYEMECNIQANARA